LNYDPAWRPSFPDSDTPRRAYEHPEYTNAFEPNSYWVEAGWSGSHMDTHRQEQNGNNIQDTGRFNWQPSTTPVDYAGPSPSSAASVYPLNSHYLPAPQSAPPQRYGQYSFQAQYSDFSETCPPAPGLRSSSTSARNEEDLLVPSWSTVKHESILPSMPSVQFSLQSKAQLMYV
jgi:hypothetical protein